MGILSLSQKQLDDRLIQVVIVAGSPGEAERIAAFTSCPAGTVFIMEEHELAGLEPGRCVFLLGRNAKPEMATPMEFFKRVGSVVLTITLKDPAGVML